MVRVRFLDPKVEINEDGDALSGAPNSSESILTRLNRIEAPLACTDIEHGTYRRFHNRIDRNVDPRRGKFG